MKPEDFYKIGLEDAKLNLEDLKEIIDVSLERVNLALSIAKTQSEINNNPNTETVTVKPEDFNKNKVSENFEVDTNTFTQNVDIQLDNLIAKEKTFRYNHETLYYHPEFSYIRFISNREKRKTTALIIDYENKKHIPWATATVTCSKDEVFNFKVGCLMALSKLFKISDQYENAHTRLQSEIVPANGQIVKHTVTGNVFALISDVNKENRCLGMLIHKENKHFLYSFGHEFETRTDCLEILEDGLETLDEDAKKIIYDIYADIYRKEKEKENEESK